MTPSWWMPASCANALRPTMALFACTGSCVSSESRRLVRTSSVVTIDVSNGSQSGFTFVAITISSSDALPARSPMPLIVHSTCRHPARSAASELATASPRSSWQWALKMTRSASCTRPRTSVKNSSISSGVQ